MLKFTIPITPITKKNHQRLVYAKGRPFILPSKQYTDYEKECKIFIPKIETIDYAINLKAIYYMPTRRRCDLVNLHEALQDILVKYGVVLDDNYKIIASTDGSKVLYDKENPRTEVTITKVEEQ